MGKYNNRPFYQSNLERVYMQVSLENLRAKNLRKILNISKVYKTYCNRSREGYLQDKPDFWFIDEKNKKIIIVELKGWDTVKQGVDQLARYKRSFKWKYVGFDIITVLLSPSIEEIFNSIDYINTKEPNILVKWENDNKDYKIYLLSDPSNFLTGTLIHKDEIAKKIISKIRLSILPKYHKKISNYRIHPCLKRNINLNNLPCGLIRMSSLQREINNPDVIIEDAIDENTKKKLNFGEMSINDTENVNLIKKKIMKTKNIQKYNKIIANFPYVRNLHFLLDIYYVENMDLSADLYSLEPFWRFMNPFMEVFDHPKKGNLEKVLFFQYLHNTFVDHNIGSCFGIVEQLTYNHYKNETTNKITLEDSQGNKITWDKEMFLYVINGKWYIKEIVYKIFKYLDKMEKLSSIVTERDIITRAKDKEPRKYKIRDDCFYLNGKGFRSSKRNNYNRISIRNDLKPEMIIEKEEIYEVKNEHKDEFQKIFNNPLTEFIHKLSFFNDSNFMLRLLPRSWEGTKLIHKLELTSEEWKIINAIIKEQFLWMGHPELTCNFGPNEAPSDTKWIFGNNINLKSKSFIPKGDINNIINKKEAINEAIKNGFAE